MSINNKELVEVIQYHIDNKMMLRDERIFNNDVDILRGFPIKISENLLLMTVVNDFHDEGFAVLRLSDVSDAYSTDSDVFFEKICISEGLQNKIRQCVVKDICSIKRIFQQMANYDGFISVQCEAQREKCTFFLGKIKEIGDEGIDFMDIGTDGKWDDEVHMISYRDITQVEFEDNYSKTLYKYVCKQIN